MEIKKFTAKVKHFDLIYSDHDVNLYPKNEESNGWFVANIHNNGLQSPVWFSATFTFVINEDVEIKWGHEKANYVPYREEMVKEREEEYFIDDIKLNVTPVIEFGKVNDSGYNDFDSKISKDIAKIALLTDDDTFKEILEAFEKMAVQFISSKIKEKFDNDIAYYLNY